MTGIGGVYDFANPLIQAAKVRACMRVPDGELACRWLKRSSQRLLIM